MALNQPIGRATIVMSDEMKMVSICVCLYVRAHKIY